MRLGNPSSVRDQDAYDRKLRYVTRGKRDVGVSAAHYDSAPGAFGGRSVTIVTADFGVRR
mgnify:CR=1 FL=1